MFKNQKDGKCDVIGELGLYERRQRYEQQSQVIDDPCYVHVAMIAA